MLHLTYSNPLFISDKFLSKSAKLRKRLVSNAVPTLNLNATASVTANSTIHTAATDHSPPDIETTPRMQTLYADLAQEYQRRETVLRAVIKQKDLLIQELKETIDKLKNDDKKYNMRDKLALPFKKRFSNM